MMNQSLNTNKDINFLDAKITGDYYSLYSNYQSHYRSYTIEQIYNSKERKRWLKKISNIKKIK